VDKVVLSRLIDITTRERVDSGALLERLIAQNPASFNFHVPLSDGGVLLGASPELLLRKEGAHFSSLPLAGSARRQPDDVLDREAGNKLLASGKDRHEHELVTQAMKTVLTPRSRELSLPDSPQLVTTPTLWHLATPIEGTALARKRDVAGLPAASDPGAERFPASGGETPDCRAGTVRSPAVRRHRRLVR
jgi:isochorismate synthase